MPVFVRSASPQAHLSTSRRSHSMSQCQADVKQAPGVKVDGKQTNPSASLVLRVLE